MSEKWTVPHAGLAAADFACILVIVTLPAQSVLTHLSLVTLCAASPLLIAGAVVNNFVTDEETQSGKESRRWTAATLLGLGGDALSVLGMCALISTVSALAAAVLLIASVVSLYFVIAAATSRI